MQYYGGVALVIKEIAGLIKAFAESGLSLQEVLILIGGTLGIITLAFTAMALVVKNMTITGIAGAVVILGGMALVLHTCAELLKAFADSGLEVNEVVILMASIFGVIIALMASIALLGPAMTAGLVPFLAVVAGISAILIVMKETIPTILDSVGNFIVKIAPALVMILNTIGNIYDRIIKQIGEILPPIIHELGRIFDEVGNDIIEIVNGVDRVVTSIFNGIADVVNTIGNVIIGIMQEFGNTIDRVFKTILYFIYHIGPAIESSLNHIMNAMTRFINFMISAVEYLANRVLDGVNEIIDAFNGAAQVTGIRIPVGKRYIGIPRFNPTYYANGGIVNLPNRGVPVAFAGEAGREGIVPLDNEQQMSLLGEAIARNIVINATINNSMDGRLISRHVQKVQQQRAFAGNI